MRTIHALRIAGLLTLAAASTPAFGQGAGTLTNPLLPSGPDPWVTFQRGFYYYIHSTGRGLAIRRTASLGSLAQAADIKVWTAPNEGPYSHGIWAPELHYLRGAWYIYFSGDAGTNQTHRIWVLENRDPDPLSANWSFKGKVADPADKWAIDATVFESGGRLYMVWSGWEGDVNGVQSLYIAALANPWTIEGRRVRLSTPEYPWEKVGDLRKDRAGETNPADHVADPVHVDVNEGPAVLIRGDRIFLAYSAAGCWTDAYSIGMLTAAAGSNLLDPAAWTKSAKPMFWQSPQAHAFGPGHNSFFRSSDGTEDWFIYHANGEANQGCGGRRSPRAQPIRWRADGMPEFGRPVAVGTPLPLPSGDTGK
jgi:GH43 family beta-xylosidase